MKIFNTMSRAKEEFVPVKPGQVSMYVCGPTVYNLIHIGNARPMIVFDTVRRYFEYKGYKVNYVSNFTDVDDKIIKRANEMGVDPFKLAEGYIDDFQQDMKDLNIKPATFNPRATQEIEEIIKEIEFDRKIQDVRIAEIQRGMASYKRVQETALTTYQFANSLKGIYNIMADVHNAMDDSGSKWPKLGSDEKTDKQKSNKGDSSSGQSSAPAAKSSPKPSQSSGSKSSSKPDAKTVDYAKELEGFQRDALKIDPPKSGSVLDVPFDELFKGL